MGKKQKYQDMFEMAASMGLALHTASKIDEYEQELINLLYVKRKITTAHAKLDTSSTAASVRSSLETLFANLGHRLSFFVWAHKLACCGG